MVAPPFTIQSWFLFGTLILSSVLIFLTFLLLLAVLLHNYIQFLILKKEAKQKSGNSRPSGRYVSILSYGYLRWVLLICVFILPIRVGDIGISFGYLYTDVGLAKDILECTGNILGYLSFYSFIPVVSLLLLAMMILIGEKVHVFRPIVRKVLHSVILALTGIMGLTAAIEIICDVVNTVFPTSLLVFIIRVVITGTLQLFVLLLMFTMLICSIVLFARIAKKAKKYETDILFGGQSEDQTGAEKSKAAATRLFMFFMALQVFYYALTIIGGVVQSILIKNPFVLETPLSRNIVLNVGIVIILGPLICVFSPLMNNYRRDSILLKTNNYERFEDYYNAD